MRGAVLLFTLIAGALPAAAQPVVLSGRVTDPQGGAVVGAELRLLREDGASARRTVSGGAGEYRFDDVPAGTYVLQVERAGFRRRADVVTLVNGSSAFFAVELSIAGVDESVEVTGSGVPRTASETSKALTVIDAAEIRDRNEASFAEIVRYTPGVQVRDNGGPGQLSQMRIRGLRPDAAAVLIDGMRFRDAATTQGDVTSFLSNLNFVAWDRVEVLRGSGSSLYGTNAVGGAVNVFTREGGGPTTGEAQLEAGSLGQFRARGSIAGSAFANRLRFAAGGLQWNVTDGLDGNDSARSTGGQGMLQYQLTPGTSVAARVLASSDRVELNTSPTASGIPAANVGGGTIVEAIPVAPEEIERSNQGLPFEIGDATYFPGRDDPDNRRESWFHATALWLRHAQSASLSFQASYQRVTTSRTFRSGPLGAGSQPPAETFTHPVGDIDTLDLRAVLTPSPWLTLTAGYELERERFRDRQDNNLPPPRTIQTETEVSQIANAGFAAAQLGLLDRRLLISLSGRIQAFSMNPIDLSAVGTRNVYEEIELEAPPRALTGDVSAAYLIARSRTKLRAHLGNAYRAPALYERFGGGFSNDPVTGRLSFTAYGDPRLEPDRYLSFDFGVDQYFWEDRFLASATYFDVDIDSMTVFDSAGRIRPESDPFGRSLGYLNGSGGFSRGLEVSLDARPAPALRLSASYTHTRAETADDVTVPGFFLVPAVFEHTATLLVTNRWSTRFDTTFDLFHGSEAYGSFFAAGRPRAYRYPAFTKAALVARYLLANVGGSPLRLYGKVDNLFDGTYYQGGWRAPGRTFVAGVSVGF
jgi:iron complex outermembrane receptor protein